MYPRDRELKSQVHVFCLWLTTLDSELVVVTCIVPGWPSAGSKLDSCDEQAPSIRLQQGLMIPKEWQQDLGWCFLGNFMKPKFSSLFVEGVLRPLRWEASDVERHQRHGP